MRYRGIKTTLKEIMQMDVQIGVEIVHCILSIVLPVFTESCFTV